MANININDRISIGNVTSGIQENDTRRYLETWNSFYNSNDDVKARLLLLETENNTIKLEINRLTEELKELKGIFKTIEKMIPTEALEGFELKNELNFK